MAGMIMPENAEESRVMRTCRDFQAMEEMFGDGDLL
jgi:hypothetical protein